MKNWTAILFAGVVGATTAAASGFMGLLAGSLIGERVLVNKEPMIEMMVGGLLGLALGIAAGGLLGLLVHRRLRGRR